jgi:hypothetical protein
MNESRLFLLLDFPNPVRDNWGSNPDGIASRKPGRESRLSFWSAAPGEADAPQILLGMHESIRKMGKVSTIYDYGQTFSPIFMNRLFS